MMKNSYYREAIDECSVPRLGNCANCHGTTLNLPFVENGMLRQAVLCPKCTYSGNPPAFVIAGIDRLQKARAA
jgi:hypothetical protein